MFRLGIFSHIRTFVFNKFDPKSNSILFQFNSKILSELHFPISNCLKKVSFSYNGKVTYYFISVHISRIVDFLPSYGQVIIERALDLPGHKLIGWAFWPVLWVYHEEHMRKAGTKIGAICVVVPRRLWCIDILTLGTIQLHHGFTRNIGETCRK